MRHLLLGFLLALSCCVVMAHTWFEQLTGSSVRPIELWFVTLAGGATLMAFALAVAREGWRPKPPVANFHLVALAICLMALGAFFFADTATWGPLGWLPIISAAYPLLLIRRPSNT